MMKRDQRRHLEAHVLGQVVVDPAAELDRLDDGGEVVVGQDHHRRPLGDLGAGDAHRHADVGLLEGRRIVHAVAGHRDDVAFLLQQAHQPDLVLRRHARDHADVGQLLLELVVAHSGELCAGQRLAFDAQLVADGRRGHRVVAGDHAHLDARAVALGDGRLGLGARRIDDADHGQEREILHLVNQVALRIESSRVEVAPCHDHDALARCGYALVFRERRPGLLLSAHQDLAFRRPERVAARDEHIGRALDEAAHDRLALFVGHVVEGGHELVVRVERHLGNARIHLPCAIHVDAALLRQHDQRTFGGIADQGAVVETGVGAQRHGQ